MASFWTFLILLLTPLITINTQAKHRSKLPSAVVVGTVYCHTCSFQTNHFIAGASVEIQCKKTSSREFFRQQVKTNSQGEFNVVLPFPVTKHAKNIKGCSVRLLTTNHPSCDAVSSPPSSSLRLKSAPHTTRVLSAGVFWSKHPQNCNKNTLLFDESKEVTDQLPFLPPNPLLPPPSILPPNPFQPPPSLIPPIFPTPPPSLFPPILPTPPFNFPPIPGLVPSPPPPILPIPLPPFPFQPTPGFPGVPPAKVSRTSSP